MTRGKISHIGVLFPFTSFLWLYFLQMEHVNLNNDFHFTIPHVSQ